MNTLQQSAKIKLTIAVITVVIIVGVIVLIEMLQKNTGNTSLTTPTTDSTSSALNTTNQTTTTSSSYKDGTYTAAISYSVPHNTEKITVTLTVANNIVTNSSIVNSESDHDSARYQEDFAAEYKSYVVGKQLSDIKLSYVAGASDTTDGFNDALAAIRSQAQA